MADDGRGYLLENTRARAGRRLDLLGQLFDPWTFGHLDAVGVTPGWRCWEVGAGGASVPAWLAERVSPTGHVLATDLETSWLPDSTAYEVRVHDVGLDPAPAVRSFDLVHARLVLVHVPDRDQALCTMVDALRPGGWLVVEDADPALQPLACLDEHGPAEVLANRLRRGFRQLLAGRGAELGYGRTLPRLLRGQGLVDVTAEAFFPVTSPLSAELEAVTVAQLRPELVAAGLATDPEVDDYLAAIAAGQLDLTTAPLVTAWGRLPTSTS